MNTPLCENRSWMNITLLGVLIDIPRPQTGITMCVDAGLFISLCHSYDVNMGV